MLTKTLGNVFKQKKGLRIYKVFNETQKKIEKKNLKVLNSLKIQM